MGNTRDFLAATDARNIASVASRLINHIAKNIKEEAEEGKCKYIYRTEQLTEEAVERVKTKFTELGYEVTVAHDTYIEEINHDYKLNIDSVFFVFKW